MLKLRIQILLLASVLVLSAAQPWLPFLDSTPNFNTFLGVGGIVPQVVKIASDQSIIIVGYSNGLVQTFSITGKLIGKLTGLAASASIVDIQWGANGVGPVVLDSTGAVSAWNSNTQPIQLTPPVTGVLGFSIVPSPVSTNQFYLALNFGIYAQEYLVTSTGISVTQKYNPISGTTFTQAMYTSDDLLLIVATNTSTIQSYNCSTGKNQNVSFSTGSSVKVLSRYYSQFMTLLTQNNVIYTFNPYDLTLNSITVKNAQSSSDMVGCISGFIVTVQTNSNTMDVWGSDGTFQKTLNYPIGTVLSIDSSTNYLATIDSKGYLAVDGYLIQTGTTTTLSGLGIGLIVGFSVLLVVGIFFFVRCIRRKRANAKGLNTTDRKQMLFTSPNTLRT